MTNGKRALDNTLTERIAKREQELFNPIREKILKAVSKVAKERGLSTVLTSSAVVDGGTDITKARPQSCWQETKMRGRTVALAAVFLYPGASDLALFSFRRPLHWLHFYDIIKRSVTNQGSDFSLFHSSCAALR